MRKTPGLTRRDVLTTTLGAAAFTLATRSAAAQETPLADKTKKWGRLPNALGARSPVETPKRTLNLPTSSRTPLQDLHGTITPADLHYERHHAGVPLIDPAKYSLTVHGMVESPMVFTLADLKRFPSVSRTYFLECAGNYARNAPETATPQTICGL